jgi:hypothetical protein
MFTTRRVRPDHGHTPAFTTMEKKLLLALAFIVVLTGVLLIVKH